MAYSNIKDSSPKHRIYYTYSSHNTHMIHKSFSMASNYYEASSFILKKAFCTTQSSTPKVSCETDRNNKENVTFCHSTARCGELYCSPGERLRVSLAMANGFLAWRSVIGLSPWRAGLLAWQAMKICSSWRATSLAWRTMSEQSTGLRTFSPKIPIFTMLSPKFD